MKPAPKYHTFGMQLLGAAIIEQAVHDFRRLPTTDPKKHNRTIAASQPCHRDAEGAKRFLFEDQTLERTIDLFALDIDAATIRRGAQMEPPTFAESGTSQPCR